MYTVRKQLYIADDQERRLKRRARELGVSEAELVRRALEAALAHEGVSLPRPDPDATVAGLLASIDRIARRSAFPATWRFSRQQAYAEQSAASATGNGGDPTSRRHKRTR
jgi:hypothetical protein